MNEEVAELKGLIGMDEVAQHFGVRLRRDGTWLAGSCPFHPDRVPSFKIPASNDRFICFGCGERGDIIDFVRKVEHCTFPEAVRRLLALVPGAGGGPTERFFDGEPEHEEPSEAEYAALEAAVSYYARALARSRRGQAYLRERGIGPRTWRRLRLGYGEPGLREELARLGLAEAGQRLGLLGRWETFRGRVVIPDLDAAGRATWLTARALPGGRDPKYLNVRGIGKPLLGLALVRSRAVVVVEGPFDWLVLQEWGVPSVALTGGLANRRAVKALTGFERVYVALDSDAVGQQAAHELAQELGDRALLLRLPDGVKDVAELAVRPDGRRRFQEALRASRREG